MRAHSESPAQAAVALRAIVAGDEAFLRRVYASTRADELAPLGWSAAQAEAFVAMQFEAQRRDYWCNYDTSRFCIVTCDGIDAGRFYVERRSGELRVVDIAVLPEFRRRGIATALFGRLFEEADADGLVASIHVEHRNPARHLYLRLGFAFRGEPGAIYRLMERPPRAHRAGRAA